MNSKIFRIGCITISLTGLLWADYAPAVTGGTVNVYFHVIRKGTGISQNSQTKEISPVSEIKRKAASSTTRLKELPPRKNKLEK